MDDKGKIDPQLEAEIRDAGDNVRDESLTKQAEYLFQVYASFRKAGFARKRSFTLMIIHYQSILGGL